MRAPFIMSLLMCVTCASRVPETRRPISKFESIYHLQLRDINDYPLKRDYALESAEYMLTNPPDERDTDWFFAADFMIRWAEGTPNYDIEPGDIYIAVKAPTSEDDIVILMVYIAAQVKLVLTNKGQTIDYRKLRKKAAWMMFDYCDDPKNKIRITESYKKVRAVFGR